MFNYASVEFYRDTNFIKCWLDQIIILRDARLAFYDNKSILSKAMDGLVKYQNQVFVTLAVVNLKQGAT